MFFVRWPLSVKHKVRCVRRNHLVLPRRRMSSWNTQRYQPWRLFATCQLVWSDKSCRKATSSTLCLLLQDLLLGFDGLQRVLLRGLSSESQVDQGWLQQASSGLHWIYCFPGGTLDLHFEQSHTWLPWPKQNRSSNRECRSPALRLVPGWDHCWLSLLRKPLPLRNPSLLCIVCHSRAWGQNNCARQVVHPK